MEGERMFVIKEEEPDSSFDNNAFLVPSTTFVIKEEDPTTFENVDLDPSPTKKARKSYEPAFKIEVIQESRRSSVAFASKMYSVNRRMVQRWIKMENKLEISSQSSKPLKRIGSGRKPRKKDPFCHIDSMDEQNCHVTESAIKDHALELDPTHYKDDNFSACDVQVEIEEDHDSTFENVDMGPLPTKRSRKCYVPAFKLEVIQESRRSSVISASKMYSVNETMVRRWIKMENELEISSQSSKPLMRIGSGRKKTLNLGLEDDSFCYIDSMDEQNCHVTESSIKDHALELAPADYKDDSFSACDVKVEIEEDNDSTYENAFLGPSTTKRSRKSYEPAFKIEVIQESRRSSVACASKMYSVTESMVRRWIKMENELEMSSQSSKPLKKIFSGRKLINLELEDDSFCYIDSMNEQNCHVARSTIEDQTLELAPTHYKDDTFSTSDGCLKIKEEPDLTFDNASLDPSLTKKSRKSYEPAFKTEVIQESRRSSVACASQIYSVTESMVRRWIKIENELEMSSQSSKPSKRLGSGRKPHNLELEDDLFCYIDSMNEQNCHVTRAEIKDYALELARTNYKDDTFTASDSWVTSFLKRSGLSLGQSTHQRSPENILPDPL